MFRRVLFTLALVSATLGIASAQVKISGLPTVSTPAPADIVPIVHSGVTSQTTVGGVFSSYGLGLLAGSVQVNNGNTLTGGLQVFDGGTTNNVSILPSSITSSEQFQITSGGANSNLLLNAKGTGETLVNYGSGSGNLYVYDGGTTNNMALSGNVISSNQSIYVQTVGANANAIVRANGTGATLINYGQGSGGMQVYDGGTTNNVSIFTAGSSGTVKTSVGALYLQSSGSTNPVYINATGGGSGGLGVFDGGAANSISLMPGSGGGVISESNSDLILYGNGTHQVKVGYGINVGSGGLAIYDGNSTNNVSIVPSGTNALISTNSNKAIKFSSGISDSSSTCGGMNACRHALAVGVYTWTFGTAFTNTPACTATEEASTGHYLKITAISNSAVTVTSDVTAANTDNADIICIGQNG